MTKRIASLALALTLAAPAAAFAQGFDAPRVDRTESRSFFGMPAWVDTAREGDTLRRDAVTTGSITAPRGDVGTVRGGRGLLAPQGGVFAE